jgi:hypothetical protein
VSEQLTSDQLDDIERRLNEFDAMVSGNAVLADRKQLQEAVAIAEWRAVIEALRSARAVIASVQYHVINLNDGSPMTYQVASLVGVDPDAEPPSDERGA